VSGSTDDGSGRRTGEGLPVLVVGRAHRVARALPAGPPAISADGRYVAFVSDSPGQVEGDRHGSADVFVRDTVDASTVLVSRSRSGEPAGGYSVQPSISGDGQVVAFTSSAVDLVDADSNETLDVFVHDLRTGRVELVSRGSQGELGDRDSFSPSISADGRYVAFSSRATTFDARDHNDAPDIFRHDRLTRRTILVSVSSAGQVGDGASVQPSISADGQVIAFTSLASNLDDGDGNAEADVFVRDEGASTTELVSRGLDGRAAGGASSEPALSADGRVVAFTSAADDIVPDDKNDCDDVFVRSLEDGAVRAVSVAPDGRPAAGHSHGGSISADGRRVAFLSDAEDLTQGAVGSLAGAAGVAGGEPTDHAYHAYLRDLGGAGTALVGFAAGRVPGDGESTAVAVSGQGDDITFTDSSTDLAGQSESDGAEHLYVAPVRTARVPRRSDQSSTPPPDMA
jgi:Tol biopolymer transport system component